MSEGITFLVLAKGFEYIRIENEQDYADLKAIYKKQGLFMSYWTYRDGYYLSTEGIIMKTISAGCKVISSSILLRFIYNPVIKTKIPGGIWKDFNNSTDKYVDLKSLIPSIEEFKGLKDCPVYIVNIATCEYEKGIIKNVGSSEIYMYKFTDGAIKSYTTRKVANSTSILFPTELKAKEYIKAKLSNKITSLKNEIIVLYNQIKKL